MADALSSLSAVHEEELPVSLRTETVLIQSGFNSSHRSDDDIDGDGWRLLLDRLLSEL